MVLQRRQEAEYAAYVSSAYSASVMQGGSIGGYYGGHPAVPVLQPMGQGSPWQPMHIGGMSAGGVHAHPGTTFLGGAPHSAGGMHAEHPGAALPVRFTHTAGGVRAEYPGIASSEGPPVNAGGVRAEYPGVGHPTGASPDAGGVHAEHRSVPDCPAEALPSAGGVHAHLGTGRMTEATPIAGGVRAEHPGVGLPSAAESGAGGALSEHPGVSSSTILEPLRQHMERLTSNFSLPTSGDLDDPVPPTREVFYPDCHDVVPADPDRRRSRRSSGPDSWARQELPFRPESVSPPTSPPSSASGSRETSVRALRRRNAKARERRLAEKAALETRTAVVEQNIAAQLTPAFAELGKGLQDTLREAMATNTDTLRGCLQQFRTQTAQATTTPQHGELMTADPVVEGTQLSAAQAAQLVKARRKSLETVVVMGGDAHAVSDGTPHARSDTAASGAEGTYLGFGAGSSSRGATRKSAGIGDHAGAGGDPGGLGGELSLPEDDPSPGPPDGKPPGDPPPGPPGGSGGSHRGRALLFTAEGASLWVPEEVAGGGVMYSMPTATGMPVTGPFGIDLFYKALILMGAPLTSYVTAGGSVIRPPHLLATPATPTHVMVVDRGVVDHLLDEFHRSPAGRGMPRPVWMYVPESFLPEEVSMLDSDCLAAWTELSSSEWFQRLCHPSESTLAIVPAAPFPMAPAATSGHATPGREAGKVTFSSPTTPAPGRPSSSAVGSRTPLSAHAPPFDPRGQTKVPSAGYADPEEPSDRAVYEESKVEQNVDKLVDKLRKFPSKSGLSEEDKVMEMEGFSRSVTTLLGTKVVQRACRRLSCHPGEVYQISVPEVLWKVTEVSLGEEQREYLEKAAGGVGTSAGWENRYADPEIFFGDLALSTLAIERLQKLRDDLAKPQRAAETANAYHTRLSARYRTVNFVAKVVPGCVPMTQTEFAYSFWRGLTHSSKVGREMRRIELDLNDPADWEERARRDGRSHGVTSAILKVLEIAGDIEATKAAKVVEVDKKAPPAISPRPLSTFWRSRAREPPRLAALPDAEMAVADAPGLPAGQRPPPGLPGPFPRERPCFACGSLDHLVRDCKDQAKVAAWRANAPARLSRQRQQVAAMFWAMSRDEGLDWVPDNLQDEVQSLAEVDPDGVMELAALTGCTDLMADIEAKVAVLRSDDPVRQ